MAIGTLSLNKILKRTANLYEAAIVLSRRARQINSKYNSELRQQLGEIENDEESPEDAANREAIVTEFDKKPKPVTQSVNDLINGDLIFRYKDAEEK